VIVEDDAFVGAGSALLEGVLVGAGAVIGAGVTLTGTSRLYDLVRERILEGTADRPLVVPASAVVVPGSRTLSGAFAVEHGLSASVAILVKDRDAGTSARVALEGALR
jgi:2,3,4,5-tetrahydropyridine-2-carboxylate N-succinyltransferase